MRCNYCGAGIENSEQHCPQCGNEASSNTKAGLGGKLISCPDCGKSVSPRAPFCPGCGAPINEPSRLASFLKRDWGFEWKSKAEIMGYPLVHVAVGRKNGKLKVAKGIIAVGQFAIGLITIAQFGIGFLFGFGQFIFGISAIAQCAIALYFGLGQLATGYIAIGQVAFGYYAAGQVTIGHFVWNPKYFDPEAKVFFTELAKKVGVFQK